MSKDIYEIITERFIEQLKKGTVPWQKPWAGVQNIVSKKPYRGINSLILGGSEFQSPYWLTFKQAMTLGETSRRGRKRPPSSTTSSSKNGMTTGT
ncbi:MAG: ArdC family protein [Verrucomicrobia bacterium]|nr:ArdC family protein [Verrucomicrobiota bacterium]